MKRQIWLVGVMIIGLSAALFAAEPLTEADKERVKKVKTIEHVLYEIYTDTDQDLASVFGYHFDWFFTDKVYGALAIFGAVEGDRGGYGIAAFGVGYRHPLTSRLFWDEKILIGSGGGGGLAAGGGLAIEAMAGLSYALMPHILLDGKVGYLTFPTGDFSTPIVNVGVSFQKFSLFLPYSN